MDLDIQVGDRITYKYTDKDKTVIELVNNDNVEVLWFRRYLRDGRIEILKIERIGSNGWYTVYEKKDLLTDEEKEFLKDIIKYHDNISRIEFNLRAISFENDNFDVICIVDYPKKLKFENINKNEYYTLKELRIGGIV